MRLFIALPVSNEVKEEFIKIQREMKVKYDSALIKWADKDQCHITVEFLGEVVENTIGRLQSIIKESIKDWKPLEFSFKNIQAFPNWQSPNVLVMQLDDLSGACRLQSIFKQKLEKAGFTVSDRKWKPHLTLGRIKGDIHSLKDLQHVSVPSIKWAVDRVELIESRLFSNGPEYFLIKDFKFK